MKRATNYAFTRVKEFIISIHALVKRATLSLFIGFNSVDISIHALVKRATETNMLKAVQFIISIHALVKRATIMVSSSSYSICNFNPRPREEGDDAE